MKTVERKNRSPESEFVVLESIPSETYKGILDALGENHLRHLYDHWTLEMRRVLYGVTWDATRTDKCPHPLPLSRVRERGVSARPRILARCCPQFQPTTEP
jgi:hypothetical protein